MITIKTLRYNDLKKIFYDLDEAEKNDKLDIAKFEIKKQLVTVKMPFTFYNLDRKTNKLIPINYLKCNKYIAYSVIDALQEIFDHYGFKGIKELGLDRDCGGGFNFRKTRNGKWWSVHAWGGSVDLWCYMGRMGEEPTIPDFCVRMFKKRGFCWGGDFRQNLKDGMHFSCCFA